MRAVVGPRPIDDAGRVALAHEAPDERLEDGVVDRPAGPPGGCAWPEAGVPLDACATGITSAPTVTRAAALPRTRWKTVGEPAVGGGSSSSSCSSTGSVLPLTVTGASGIVREARRRR